MNKHTWILLLSCAIAACQHLKGSLQIEASNDSKNEAVGVRDFELFKIDNTLKQLAVEHKKAQQAISVNDSEKVYLERFAEQLQEKRKAVCKKLKKDLVLERTC